jgi:hypothetical protein
MSDINEMNQEQITTNDILNACCGTDGADNTKAGFSLDFGIYNPTTNEFDIKTSTTYCNPVLNITRVGETAMIDFIFETKTDSELRRICALMQKYGKDVEAAFQNGAKNIPFMRTQIVPISFSGRFSVTAYGPLYWVLQPEYPTGEVNMIRMVFKTESVLFAENEAYDEVEMAAQLQREEMQREYVEMQHERRKQEDDDYRDERQRNLEELRRNRQDY